MGVFGAWMAPRNNVVDLPVAGVMAFVAHTHVRRRPGDSGRVPVSCHRMFWCRAAPPDY